MPKLKNPLTPDKHNVPQEQNFVTIGLNGNHYCINWDCPLFWYLKHQSKKDCQKYVKEFPFFLNDLQKDGLEEAFTIFKPQKNELKLTASKTVVLYM